MAWSSKRTWANSPSTATPITAAALQSLEDGVEEGVTAVRGRLSDAALSATFGAPAMADDESDLAGATDARIVTVIAADGTVTAAAVAAVDGVLDDSGVARVDSPSATVATVHAGSKDYVADLVGPAVGRATTLAYQFTVPVTAADGTVALASIPVDALGTVFRTIFGALDGSVAFTEVNLGSSVRLREVQGARGHRLQYTSRNPADENARPYMEVNASDADFEGDVIAGYQSHVTGSGETPNTEERVYWFLEAHGLTHTVSARPEFEGWYSMGVSNRAELTARGNGRTFIIDAGNRPGFAFHFYKPYIELLRNTALVVDDRARPLFGDGIGENAASAAGTIHGGDCINLRREGALGIRMSNFSNTANVSSNIFMGRGRGTVLAPTDVQSGDRLGAIQAGTQTTVSPDYVHIPGAGAGPENLKRVTTQILSIATENFTPSTAEGSRIDVEVTPTGTATRVVGLSVEAPTTAEDTSILVRVNRAGTITQSRVMVGPPDSGGTGYRALRVAN